MSCFQRFETRPGDPGVGNQEVDVTDFVLDAGCHGAEGIFGGDVAREGNDAVDVRSACWVDREIETLVKAWQSILWMVGSCFLEFLLPSPDDVDFCGAVLCEGFGHHKSNAWKKSVLFRLRMNAWSSVPVPPPVITATRSSTANSFEALIVDIMM